MTAHLFSHSGVAQTIRTFPEVASEGPINTSLRLEGPLQLIQDMQYCARVHPRQTFAAVIILIMMLPVSDEITSLRSVP